MKKIFNLLLAFALVGAVACEDSSTENDNIVWGNSEFSADVETESRTALDGTSTVWTDSDRLSIFDGVANNQFVMAENSLTTAIFRGDVAEADSYTAIHPYTAAATLESAGVVSDAVVKATQTAVANSFDTEASLSIALSENNKLEFKNVCAMFKFTALSSGNVAIKTNTAGEYLAGTVRVTYDGVGEPTATVTSGGSQTVTLNNVQQGKTYCIAVLPISMKAGFTVLFDGIEVRKISSAVTLKRSRMLNIGEVGAKTSWSVVGTFNDWNELRHPMFYGPNGLLVCKNVSLATTNSRKGFKFCYSSWTNQYGAYGYDTQPVPVDSELGKWYVAQPNNSNFKGDIVLDTSYRYDIYLDLADNRFQVVKAGGATPSHVVSVVGGFGSENWSVDHICTYENGWFVARNLTTSGGCDFKFRLNNSWDCAMGDTGGTTKASSGVEYNTGGDNASVAAGTWDFYLKADYSRFKVVKK